MDVKTSENLILFDWLSFSVKKENELWDVIKMLGLQKAEWTQIYGFYGYKNRMYNGGISIMYDGTEDMGFLVEMSGQGCRTFETIGNGDYEKVFNYIKSKPDIVNITRLDIAFDDHTGIFNIDRLYRDTDERNFISRSECHEIVKGSKGISITHGRKASNTLIRIYDKAKERGYEDGEHWIRLELQLRHENAFGFIKNETPINERFLGVVYNYLRYVVPKKDDINTRRWPNTPYWNRFLAGASKIRIYSKPGIEYNEYRLHHYVVEQAGNSANVYREIYGDNKYLEELDKRRAEKEYSDTQRYLIEKHNRRINGHDYTGRS